MPCETCGKPTTYLGTKRCDRCWQVERLLDDYMKSPGGLRVVRNLLPKLDDWVDGHCDAWDYEAVLRDNNVRVVWDDTWVDGCGNEMPAGEFAAWSMSWKQGCISIGPVTETIARKAAALFV